MNKGKKNYMCLPEQERSLKIRRDSNISIFEEL